MEISNVPVSCHVCRGTAYGRSSSYKYNNKLVTECIWVCSNCGQVTKRHSEETPINDQQTQQN